MICPCTITEFLAKTKEHIFQIYENKFHEQSYEPILNNLSDTDNNAPTRNCKCH